MPSNSIPHYLYKRNHTWWFRKRFVSEGNAIEYRLSLQTASFQRARLLALRLQTLCQQMVASLGAPKKLKNGVMEKSAQEQIKAKLRAKIAKWTAEETEHWFSGSARNEGDLNDYLETLDMVVSDLKERIAYDDKPSLHRAEASTVLDELPHLKATLSDYNYQVIARMVAQAKVNPLQNARAIILGGDADRLTTSPVSSRETSRSDVHLLLDMINKYQTENASKEHSQKSQDKYAHSLALTLSFFGNVPLIATASSLEDQVIDLSCPSNVRGTLHMNNSWEDGYFSVRGFGVMALRSFEQQNWEQAVLTFSNGDVRAKIRTWVKDNVIHFYLWDQGDGMSCDWQ